MKIHTYNCKPHEHPYVRDIEPFQLTIMGQAHDYVVIDREENRLFSTDAATPIDAACAYISWVYGEVRVLEWDEEELGYCETDEFMKAGFAYDYIEQPLSWELAEG